jgi:oligopeptide/dipeptide ABC transporter ATP-binding protein
MTPLLEVEKLEVRLGGVPVVQKVSLRLDRGETLGLVGESGSGKSTLARAILRLIPAMGGEVRWLGEDLLTLSAGGLRARRRDLQIVFQDPLASLNPRMTIGDTLAEPLAIFEGSSSAARRQQQVAQMLERVGLPADAAARRPHEFSGGQCQRVAIARAMMLRPKLLICDEPVSSLDVSIQGQIINLLADLQRDTGTAMLFISHNLAVVRHLCHRVAVMYRGRLVEVGSRDAVFERPAHPYTRALLAAVPDLRRAATGELPEAAAEASSSDGSGCPYRPRCAFAAAVCAVSVPPLENVDAEHSAACHRWRDLVYS